MTSPTSRSLPRCQETSGCDSPTPSIPDVIVEGQPQATTYLVGAACQVTLGGQPATLPELRTGDHAAQIDGDIDKHAIPLFSAHVRERFMARTLLVLPFSLSASEIGFRSPSAKRASSVPSKSR